MYIEQGTIIDVPRERWPMEGRPPEGQFVPLDVLPHGRVGGGPMRGFGDIAPIPADWVVEKWFAQYAREDDLPDGMVGFGTVVTPSGYETVEILVDPDYGFDEFKARFARWLRTPPKSGRFAGVPMSGVLVGRVTISWSSPDSYTFRHARPTPLAGDEDTDEVIDIPCYSIPGEGKMRPIYRDYPITPPFYVEFAGPKTNQCCKRAGPFGTIDEATRYAGKHGGYKAAPRDGWFQVFDSRGQIALIT